jgi:hypothetical protein
MMREAAMCVRITLPAILASAGLSLACASSGGDSGEVFMPPVYSGESPTCDFTQVGWLTYQEVFPEETKVQDLHMRAKRYRYHERNMTRASRDAVQRMGGDALLEVEYPPDGSVAYMVIRFTDPDCRE